MKDLLNSEYIKLGNRFELFTENKPGKNNYNVNVPVLNGLKETIENML